MPKTLSITMTINHEDCLALLEKIRWNGKPKCPYCGSAKATAYKNEHRYHCNECFTSYSVTVDTLFHKTHVDLNKWFIAISLVMKLPGGISVRQLAKEIRVNRNTAAFMIVRIHKSMIEDQEFLQKLIDIDNSYF